MAKGLTNLIICFVISIIVAPLIIKGLQKLKFGQNILVYVKQHESKSGTATMGGLIFIMSACIGYVIFFSKNNTLATISILSLLFFGMLGFLDDFIKIKFKQNEGLKPYQKIIGQFGLATIIAIFIYMSGLVGGSINLPFTNKSVDIGFWIIPFVIVFYIAVVNSVNLIDGLDGLCGGVSSVVIAIGAVIIYILSLNFSGVYLAEINNIIVISLGVVGAVLGFLCYNCFPARVFMGDTGSLALGGFIASLFALTKNYLLIISVGIMYVVTSVSVIIQVLVYKLTHKRVFKMSPLHHHFEQGSHENKVTITYVLVSIVIGLLTISIYLY